MNEELLQFETSVRKLALNNLAMDRNYYRNRFSFLCLEKMGIFPLQNHFAELRINEHSSGLYLAIQKPEDYIRSQHSSLLVRRDLEGGYAIEASHGDYEKSLLKSIRHLPALARHFEGQQLYDTLNAVLNLEHYFQWLAFNFLKERI